MNQHSPASTSSLAKLTARCRLIPVRELFEGGERAFEVWLVSITMTKLRLSPTLMHSEIARGRNTIFGAQESLGPNVNLRRIEY
jgi:hypothetical protein